MSQSNISALKQQVMDFISSLADQQAATVDDPVKQSSTNVENLATEGVEIKLYGPVGYADSSAANIVNEIDKAPQNQVINLRINSPGGDFYDGATIYNALKDAPNTVHAYIEGMAASAASFIAMAADKVFAYPYSSMMIHEPSAAVKGSERDMRIIADNLSEIKAMLVDAYNRRMKAARDEVEAMVSRTTWFTAEQSVAAGLADEIYRREGAIAFEPTVFWQQQYDASLVNLMAGSKTEAEQINPVEEDTEMNSDQTIEQIKAQYEASLKDAVAKVEQAAADERARLQQIDALALPGYEALVNRAKYEEPMSPGDFAAAMLTEEKRSRAAVVHSFAADEAIVAPVAQNIAPVKASQPKDPILQEWESSAELRDQFAEYEDFKALREFDQAS